MKTREEVEQLKRGWLKDPCWELSDAEGYEEYTEELRQFQIDTYSRWDRERNERDQAAADAAGLTLDQYREYKSLRYEAGRNQQDAHKLLSYYIVDLCMGGGQRDNYTEVEIIVESIISAAVAEVKAELIMGHNVS